MNKLWAPVIAVVLGLTAFGGMIAAFLLDTAIMPWAVAVLISYNIWRTEMLHKKTDFLEEDIDNGDT